MEESMPDIKERLILQSEIKEYVDEFKFNFFTKFGVKANVFYDISNPSKIPAVSLVTLENIINSILESKFPNSYPEGIRTKSRESGFIIFRHMFFKIAIEMGYTLTYTGKYLKYSHCQVLWSNNLIKRLIDIKDKDIVPLYEMITEKIKIVQELKK